MNQPGCAFGQHMVDRPKFEGSRMNRRGRRENQVLSRKSGIIRKDKRNKVRYI